MNVRGRKFLESCRIQLQRLKYR